MAELTGDLTLRGVTRPLTLKALRFACRMDDQRESSHGGEIVRTTYHMLYGWPFIANSVRLQVQVEGVRKP